MAKARIFRQEAIDYHFRDPESSGVLATRVRWTPAVLIVVVALLVASAAYAFFAREVVRALFERLLR